MEFAFWTSFLCVAYAYLGYPLALSLVAYLRPTPEMDADEPPAEQYYPTVSIVIPAHNEAAVIGRKLENTLSLDYSGEIEVIVVSDGSTDDTASVVRSFAHDTRLIFIDLPERKGKAKALNSALEYAAGEIIVFSDASIILENDAILEIVKPFADGEVGCVSGEDRIEGAGGESLYGRYELYLRRQESALGSIVGASGSFYAQRKELVAYFPEGVAPDFLSVLNTAREGYRAVSTSAAKGFMTSVVDSRSEFQRKIRTVIRGLTALFENIQVLNPFKFPLFAFFLFSHKLMRWLVPFFLTGLILSNLFLINYAFYRGIFVAQFLFYLCAVLAYVEISIVARSIAGKIALYFSSSNLAILIAWYRYLRGVRQEIWAPSKRSS